MADPDGTIACMKCGAEKEARLIDAKPSNGDWENGEFDLMLCQACYGPGWLPLYGEPYHG